jgi:hypothetical protein
VLMYLIIDNEIFVCAYVYIKYVIIKTLRSVIYVVKIRRVNCSNSHPLTLTPNPNQGYYENITICHLCGADEDLEFAEIDDTLGMFIT